MPFPNFISEEELVSFVTTVNLPEWQRKLFKRYSDAVQVHSEGQLFYKIDRLFPNEHIESKRHRIMAFDSVTEASFGRAANNVTRIFKNSSYTVEASESTLNTAAAPTFGGEDFYSWFLDEWVMWSLRQDPNAHFVVYPPEYTKKTGRQSVAFIASEHLRHISEEAVVFVSEDESTVEYELTEVKVHTREFFDQSINMLNLEETRENTYAPKVTATIKKYVYHAFFQGLGFYRVEQVQGQNTKQWDVEFYPMDFIPVTDVGGERGGKAKKKVNKSFLHPFVAFGNLALLQHSQHTAVNFTFSFPRMSEIESACDAQGCNEGYITCETAQDLEKYPDGKKPCGKCKGEGWITPQSPYKIYKKRVNSMDSAEEQAKVLSVPDVQYYTPPVAVLEYSRKEWKDYLEMAEIAVYLQAKVKTGNVESAESKKVDREDFYAFLARVGKVFFGKMRFALQCFENYNSSRPTYVSVPPPFSYAILTEGEAFEALKTVLESNAPVMFKANQVDGFLNKFVSQSSPIRKFMEVLKLVDPLLYYTANELAAFKVSNVITGEMMATHVFAYPILLRMYSTDRNIFLQPVPSIVTKLEEELKAYKPEEPDGEKLLEKYRRQLAASKIE